MRLTSLLPLLLHLTLSFAADSRPLAPCTIYAPTTNAYYDLNPVTVRPLKDHKKAHKDDRTESWHARGYGMGTNFTLNFCAPVIETIEEAVGIKESQLKNISAFYEWKEKTYSIGYVSKITRALSARYVHIGTILYFLHTAQWTLHSYHAKVLLPDKPPPNSSSVAENSPSSTRTALPATLPSPANLPPPTSVENSMITTTTEMTMTTRRRRRGTRTRKKTIIKKTTMTMTRSPPRINHPKTMITSEGNQPSYPSHAIRTSLRGKHTSPS